MGDLPSVRTPAMRATVLVGELAGDHGAIRSPAGTHTPLLAADITLAASTQRFDLDEEFEHGVLVLEGQVATVTGGQLLLLGGTPWEEEFILFWRLLAGGHEEIVELRRTWVEGTGAFTSIPGVDCRAQAPEIPPVRLRPRRGSARAFPRPATV